MIKNIVRIASLVYFIKNKDVSIDIPRDTVTDTTQIRDRIDNAVDSTLEEISTVRDITSPDWSDSVSASLQIKIGAKKKTFLGITTGYKYSAGFVLYVTNKLDQPINIVGARVTLFNIMNIKGFLTPYTFAQYKIYPGKTATIRLVGMNSKTNNIPLFVPKRYNRNGKIEVVDNTNVVLTQLMSLGKNNPLQGFANVTFVVPAGKELVTKTLEKIDCSMAYSGDLEYAGYNDLTIEERRMSLIYFGTQTPVFHSPKSDNDNPFMDANEVEI